MMMNKKMPNNTLQHHTRFKFEEPFALSTPAISAARIVSISYSSLSVAAALSVAVVALVSIWSVVLS